MLRVFTDSRCLEHRAPPGYPERPERLSGVIERLRAAGREIEPEPAHAGEPSDGARSAVLALHDERYVERLRAAVQRGDGLIDSADNPLSAGTWRAAWAAAECALRAADWAVADAGRAATGRAATDRAAKDRAAFAAVRPPGHHAERATAMGFCFFGNVAVAAEHLIRHHGLERVAIVDFDVHHGNGTQHLYEDRGDVLFVSLHQHPFYPGTGAAEEVGFGDGRGATLNVPLAAGAGDDVYFRAMDQQVLPALREFAPRMLLISAGFDAWRDDPLGGMRVTESGFERIGQMLAAAASELCGGRSVSLLEGGYDLGRLGDLVECYLAGLSGTAVD
ncbi:MAG: histone deacetylase [bacterium]|nr:histone deacetylase [bacterium]